MRIRLSVKSRIGSLAVALPTAAAMLFTSAPPAHAVDPGTILGAAKAAYEAYKKFAGGELTLDQATTRIINAIDTARDDILAQIELIAAAQVKACARSAVIDVADIRSMTRDTVQAFARDSTNCATLAEALISASESKPAVDQLGFAVNTVGPIALLARTHAGLTTPLLKQTLTSANRGVIAKLTTSCHPTPLWGDAVPGGVVEIILRCTAYPGHVGVDVVYMRLRRGQPLPQFDYSAARAEALSGTSQPIADAALPLLT